MEIKCMKIQKKKSRRLVCYRRGNKMINQYYTGIENTLPTMEEYPHSLIEKSSGTSIESSSLNIELNLNSVSRRFTYL